MAIRRFHIDLSCIVEVDADVIDGVDAEWRKRFYDLDTPEEVAQHIAFNLLANGARLSQLDGFADRHDDAAAIPRDTIDVQAEEIQPPRRRRRTG